MVNDKKRDAPPSYPQAALFKSRSQYESLSHEDGCPSRLQFCHSGGRTTATVGEGVSPAARGAGVGRG